MTSSKLCFGDVLDCIWPSCITFANIRVLDESSASLG